MWVFLRPLVLREVGACAEFLNATCGCVLKHEAQSDSHTKAHAYAACVLDAASAQFQLCYFVDEPRIYLLIFTYVKLFITVSNLLFDTC